VAGLPGARIGFSLDRRVCLDADRHRQALAGRLTGVPDNPAATAEVTLTEAVLAGNPVSEARLDADFTDLLTRPAGRVSLEGWVADLPARAKAELKMEQDDMIRIDGLALELASLIAEGAVTPNADHTASGQVSVSIGSLADLTPLIGETLSGTGGASVSLSRDDGRQMVDARVSVSGAGLAGLHLRTVKQGSILRPYRRTTPVPQWCLPAPRGSRWRATFSSSIASSCKPRAGESP